MKPPENFVVWFEDDRIPVRFVSARTLGHLPSGHAKGGDFDEETRVVRLLRFETRRANQSALLHELGHYFARRSELRAGAITEEDACDLLSYLPTLLHDPRNAELRDFLGL